MFFQGIIEEISERKALDNKLREYVNQLMCQILGFARGGKYKVTDFNINNSVKRVVSNHEWKIFVIWL